MLAKYNVTLHTVTSRPAYNGYINLNLPELMELLSGTFRELNFFGSASVKRIVGTKVALQLLLHLFNILPTNNTQAVTVTGYADDVIYPFTIY